MTAPRWIEYIDVDEIVPAIRNPRLHLNIEDVKASIRESGFVESAVHDGRTGRILAGHGRTRALVEMRDAGEPLPEGVTADDGRWLMPVTYGWSSRDDAEAERMVLWLNRAPERGGWDDTELVAMLGDLQQIDGGLIGTGFVDAELSGLLDRMAQVSAHERRIVDRDDVPSQPVEPISRLGDVWMLGPHRVVCGDATTDEAWTLLLPAGERVSCVWTDPPYGICYSPMRRGDLIQNDDSPTVAAPVLAAALSRASDPVCVFVCCDWRSLGGTAVAMTETGLIPKACIVWDKQVRVQNLDRFAKRHEMLLYAGPFGGEPTVDTDVWEIPRDYVPDHPTPKPVALIERSLGHATLRGDVVVDPFAGSGSTLIACHETGRIARCIEVDPAYVDVICRRWQAYTGEKPVRASTGEPVDFDPEE